MLAWAINRAGFELQRFTERNPTVQLWLAGDKQPTMKQLEEFSRKVYLPFGYLFLPEPPKEKLPIPFFRTDGVHAERISVNVYDTILLLQQRQDWLKNYLSDNDFKPLGYVGKFRNSMDVKAIVASIRDTLNLPGSWASKFKTWQEAQNHLIERIEDAGIITVFNGVVDNNTHRKIQVDDCRGFVLVDKMAPFMFINNSDWKSAQMFTLIHELAHIWTGQSAGFDFRKLQPANNPIEKLCDQVAAEFLVPENNFREVWNSNSDMNATARYFKVSEIVIARRALDIGVMSKKQFFAFYEQYSKRERIKKEHQSAGGEFYATTKNRISLTFASHINHAVKSGELLYRDACKLTSLKGDTFNTFFSKYF